MAKGPTGVLELKLNTTTAQEQELDHRFAIAGRIKNVIINHAQKQLNILDNTKEFHKLRQEYHALKEAGVEDAIAPIKTKLNKMVEERGLSRTGLCAFVVKIGKKYSKYIDANTCQCLCDDVLDGIEKVLYGDGKHLHNKSFIEIVSLRGKNNKQGIRFKDGKLVWGKMVIQPQLRKKDIYARKALKNSVKYCRIVRKMLGTKWHYYLQIVYNGSPPEKHKPGKGPVGIDNGPSAFAVVGDNKVDLIPLGLETSKTDRQIEYIQQAMGRSLRANNPDRYNEDGTVKKGIRKRWIFSHRYKVLRRRLKSLSEREARRREQHAELIANSIMSMGDQFTTEPLSYSGLKKRAKKTTINETTGRSNSKKRFGSSINENAPGTVEVALKRKLGYFGLILQRVNLRTYRASQYDHIANTYTKKELNQRWTKIGNRWIQRDMYSALLLQSPNLDLESINRNAVSEKFESFCAMHDALITKLRSSDIHLPSCCGIHKEKK